jgi:hypothetical protein
MGKLNCGCEIIPGAPVSKEMVKAHKEHTLHALFLWDIMIRHGATPEQTQAREKLMMARIAYQEALDAVYPD